MSGTYPLTRYRRAVPGAFITGHGGNDTLLGFAKGDFVMPGETKPFDFRDYLRPEEKAKPRPVRPSAWPRRTFARPAPPPPYQHWLPFIREYLTPRAILKVFPGSRAVSAVIGLLELAPELVPAPASRPALRAGWFLKCDNGQRPLNAYKHQWGSSSSFADAVAAGLSCGLPLQVPTGPWVIGKIFDSTAWPPGAGWVWEELQLGPYNTAKTRLDIACVVKVISQRAAGFDPAPLYYPRPVLLEPTPWPMPYALIPYRDRGAYRDLGDPLPGEPRSQPSLERTPPRHVGHTSTRSPPGKGTKEEKIILSIKGRSTIGILLNLATETFDAINAFYWALPKHVRNGKQVIKGGRVTWVRRGYMNPYDKLELVYDHFRDLDFNKLIENLIVMQWTDRMVGTIGRTLTRGQKKAIVEGYLSRGNLMTGPAL